MFDLVPDTAHYAQAWDHLLSPQSLAEQIVQAVRTNRDVLRTPWQVKFLPLISALLPYRLQRWLGDRLGVLDSMTTWQGITEPARVAKEPSLPTTTEPVPLVLSE